MLFSKKKSAGQRLHLTVRVLQNGIVLADAALPVTGRRTLRLSDSGRGNLVLPYYILPNTHLEICAIHQGRVELAIDGHHFDGFYTSKGEVRYLRSGTPTLGAGNLTAGDYASLAFKDLRILIKVGPPQKTRMVTANVATPKWARAPLSRFLFRSKGEAIGLVAATGAALTIAATMTLTLALRSTGGPTAIRDIPEDYLLSFISPSYLKTAPEALQGDLDRTRIAHGVYERYSAVSAMLMGQNSPSTHQMFPDTAERYEGMFADSKAIAAAASARQRETDELQGMKAGVARIAIPAVVGETIDGTIARVIDKLALQQEALDANLSRRRIITGEFAGDPDYGWNDYRNAAATIDRSKSEFLGKIHPFQAMSDEEFLYAEALDASQRAFARQRSRITPQGASLPQPIAMADGAKYSSFMLGRDLKGLDQRLHDLSGSAWQGWRNDVAVMEEPSAGEIEPNLVEKTIKRQRFQLQLCYELALRRNSSTAGTMEWRWRIGTRGDIDGVALVASTVHDARMAECIRQKIAAWRFPRPRRGSVEVSYPFEFSPAKG